MNPSSTAGKTKSLSPTVLILCSATMMSWPGFVVTAAALPLWHRGAISAPLSLATLHWFVLGVLLTTVYGVLFQFVPIAFQAPPLPRRLLYWHLPVHVGAVCLMTLGFLFRNMSLVGWGGTSVLSSAILFLWFLFGSYRRARNQTAVHHYLSLPWTGFAFVSIVGLLQAFRPDLVNVDVLTSHAMFGGFVFWVGLVMVISYKLVPMFALSHGHRASLRRTAGLFFPGLLTTAVVILWQGLSHTHIMSLGIMNVLRLLRDLGAVLGMAGIASLALDLHRIIRARKRKRIVLPLREALVSVAVTGLSTLILLVAFLGGWRRALVPASYLLLYGGLVPMIFSYAQKMVPFLWFEYRFSRRPERKTAPLIDDMVPKHRAALAMTVYFLGVGIGFILSTGIGPRANPAVTTLSILSAVLTTSASVLLLSSLLHVLKIGGPRPMDQDDSDGSSTLS